MKKLVICLNVLALTICTGAASYGKAIDENTAKTVGANYLISNEIQGVRSVADLVTADVVATTVNGVAITDYYVFNFVGSKGFIIVSGDDNIIPVLAFSGESAYDVNHMSPDTKWWLNGYKAQITDAIEREAPAKTGTASQWASLKAGAATVRTAARTTSIFPSSTVHLVQTKWDQEPLYNSLCPSGTPTGCVATCMAEVMQYWNWPTVGTGYHSYTAAGYGVKTADFANTAYDWTTMGASLNASSTATALLMYHAGIAVDMDYTTTSAGSGAYVIDMESPVVNSAEYALRTYFHFKPTLHGVPRSGEPSMSIAAIPDATWIAMIDSELNNSRPVMYTGQGSDGGHCWICDGYNASALFHFNFGWSGSFNGYYTIDNVDPGPGGTGGGAGVFDDDQSIVIGIKPDSFPNITGNLKLQANLNSTNSLPLGYGTPFSFTTKIMNSGTSPFSGDFCAQVFDTSNALMGTVQTLTGQTIAAGATSSTLTFASTGMYNLLAEHYYHVQVMYRTSSSAPWAAVANSGTYYNYNVIDVTNDTDLLIYSPVLVTSTLPVPSGGTISVFSQIADDGTNNFSGTFEAVLINVSTGVSYTVQTLPGSALISGNYDDFSFSGSVGTAPAGTYALVIKHQYNGTGNFYTTGNRYYPNPILVQIGAGSHVGLNTVSLADNVSVYPNPAKDIVTINMTGIDVTGIRITDIEGRDVLQVAAPGSQSIVNVPVGSLAAGVYLVQLQTSTELIVKKIVIAK